MVWITGGEFKMGAVVNGHGSHEMPMASNDAEPIHPVRVDGFWMDKTVVTNAEFEKFVTATGYVTIAERKPSQEEYPDAPPENLALSLRFLKQYAVCPLADNGVVVSLLVADPQDPYAAEAVALAGHDQVGRRTTLRACSHQGPHRRRTRRSSGARRRAAYPQGHGHR